MQPNQLSKTAAFLAIKFYGLTRDQQFRSLFDEPVITFYDRVVQDLPKPLCHYHYWLQFNPIRCLYVWSEELLLPGDLLHVIARKLFVRQLVDDFIANGYTQILVLGAGFDDLAFTYQLRGVQATEIDVPLMAQTKKRFFTRWYPRQEHPAIVSAHIDPKQPEIPFNQCKNLDPGEKTLVIAEGFFDYLQGQTTSKLLDQIQRYFTSKPGVITTHFALDELPSYHQWVFKTSVNAVGEKLKLHHPIQNFEQLLAQSGFTIKDLYDYNSLDQRLRQYTGTSLSILKGFYIITAE